VPTSYRNGLGGEEGRTMDQAVATSIGVMIGIAVWGCSFIMPPDGRIAPRVIRTLGMLITVFTGVLYFAWPAIHFS
jgi:hypothetical protein